jgi:hypothetical protein
MRAIPRSLDDSSSPLGEHVLVRAANRIFSADDQAVAWRRTAAMLEAQLGLLNSLDPDGPGCDSWLGFGCFLAPGYSNEQICRATSWWLAAARSAFVGDPEAGAWIAGKMAVVNAQAARLLGARWG